MRTTHHLRALLESTDDQITALNRQRRELLALVELTERNDTSPPPASGDIPQFLRVAEANRFMKERFDWAARRVERLRYEQSEKPEYQGVFHKSPGESTTWVNIPKLIEVSMGAPAT